MNEVTPLCLIYRLISAVCVILNAYSELFLLTLPYGMHCVTLKQKKCASLHLNFILILMFSSLFFHIARTPFPCRFKPTPSGHLHSGEICISKSNEKLGYMYLDIISAVGQPAL